MARFTFSTSPLSLISMLLAGAALIVGLSLAVAIAAPSTASGALIQAHRGGPNIEGVAAFPENSMSAFRHSIKAGWMIELDVASTEDGVIIVMHDPDLKRTTNCTGVISLKTWAEIKNCELDTIGIGSPKENLDPGDPRRQPIPTLANVITLLERTRGRASIEVKDFSAEVAQVVYRQLAASKVPPRRLYIQNFYPPNLVDVPSLLPGAKVVLLITKETAGGAIDMALERGADAVSPGWPFAEDLPAARDFVTRAHQAGLPVIPWTIDDPEEIEAAAGVDVDEIISNDPTLAYRLVGTDPEPEPEMTSKLRFRVQPPRVRVRKGGIVRFRVLVRNAGKGTSGPIRLRSAFPRALLRLVGRPNRVVRSIPAGRARVVRFNFRTGRRARAGRVANLRFGLREVRQGARDRVGTRAARVRIVRRR